MTNKMVVHTHMHPRRTGVTTHIESILPGLVEMVDVAWVGKSVDPELPKMSVSLLYRYAKQQPIVLHVHRNNEMMTALLLRAFGAKLRTVYTRHSATPPGWLTRMLLKKADKVVSLTEDMASKLPVASELIPHGVNNRRFSPTNDRTKAWAELGFEGELGIGVVGRIRPDKGQGDFVSAIAPLLGTYPSWRAVLVGSTRGNESFASCLKESAGSALIMTGERPDVEKIYRGLSIVVQPSRSEGFGLVSLEAMASGCCLVSTTSGAANQIVRDGETGFLYPAGDTQALRKILERLMKDPGLADEIGRRGAREVASRFSVIKEIGALADVYSELLG